MFQRVLPADRDTFLHHHNKGIKMRNLTWIRYQSLVLTSQVSAAVSTVSCRTRFRITCCVRLPWVFSLDTSPVFPGLRCLNAFEEIRQVVVASRLPQCGLIRCVLTIRLGLASLAGMSRTWHGVPLTACRVVRSLLSCRSCRPLWRSGYLPGIPFVKLLFSTLKLTSLVWWSTWKLCKCPVPHQTSVSSFIIFMYKFSQFCPVGALSRWFLSPFQMSSSFFEPFLAFCHNKMFQAHLVLCSPQPWNRPCLQGALFLWLEKSFHFLLFFKLLNFVLEYNRLAILWSFQMDSKVTQHPYTPLPSRLPHDIERNTLSIQEVPVGYREGHLETKIWMLAVLSAVRVLLLPDALSEQRK